MARLPGPGAMLATTVRLAYLRHIPPRGHECCTATAESTAEASKLWRDAATATNTKACISDTVGNQRRLFGEVSAAQANA